MALVYVMNARKEKVCNAPIRLSDLSDDDLIYQITRFPRAAVSELTELMRDDLQHPTARSHAVPVDTQMCWLRSNSMDPAASSGWSGGAAGFHSRPSVSQLTQWQSHPLSLVKRATEFIKFRTDQRTVVANKLAFNAVANFPNACHAH